MKEFEIYSLTLFFLAGAGAESVRAEFKLILFIEKQ